MRALHLRRWAPALMAIPLLALSACGAGSPTTTPSAGGGTLVATYSGTLPTIDPNKDYNNIEWLAGYSLYRGLYMLGPYGHVHTAVAASLPVVSHHGLTYTVTLKSGLKWSNGDPITAQDFVTSLDRELAPNSGSPDGYLWYMLKGAAAYQSGQAPTLAGVRATGRYTIQYLLSQPYPPFVDILTTPAAFPVDPAHLSTLASQPVTDGPWTVSQWNPATSITFKPNPHYTLGQLKFHAMKFEFNVQPNVGILRVQAGQADLVIDGIPSAQYQSLNQSPTWSKDVLHIPAVAVYLLALNTKVAPFTHLKVRQAVEMAINPQHIIRLLQNRGRVVHGVIPTSMPGFATNIPNQYPYNPAQAKTLLARAGYPHGFTVTLGVGSEGTGGQTVSTAIQANLAAIGITAQIKPLPQESTALAQVPMTTYNWFMDYPDPADFIDGFTSCASAVVGGSNPAFLCNAHLDQLAAAARALPLGAARVAAYKRVDAAVMQQAAYVPLYVPILTLFHSRRLTSPAKNPVFFPAVLNQYWSRGS